MTTERCIRCGGNMQPAGTSNQIDGKRYHGLPELADSEWVICPTCFTQDRQGDWLSPEYGEAH